MTNEVEQEVKDETQGNEPYRPTRLDLTQLPRDPKRALGSLRQQLCASFNYCRAYPAKMDVLDATLTHVLKEVRKFKVELAAQEKAKAAKQPVKQEVTE